MRIASLAALAALIVGGASLSQAQSACSPVRLDTTGGPMESMPVIEQGPFDVCRYAVAADLLSASLFHQSGGTRRSQVSWVSIFSKSANYDASNSLKKMLELSRQFGACPASAVERLTAHDEPLCVEAEQGAVAIAGRTNTRGKASSLACSARADWPAAANNDSNEGHQDRDEFLLHLAIGARPPNPKDLDARIEEVCKSERVDASGVPETEQLFGYRLATNDERLNAYASMIDRNLDARNPMPTGLLYCADVLQKASATGVDPIDGKHYKKLCTIAGLHASTIIGRRQSNRGCEYLVKNSWGSSCRGYDRSNECDAGKIWVRKEDLLRNTAGAYGIKRAGE